LITNSKTKTKKKVIFLETSWILAIVELKLIESGWENTHPFGTIQTQYNYGFILSVIAGALGPITVWLISKESKYALLKTYFFPKSKDEEQEPLVR